MTRNASEEGLLVITPSQFDQAEEVRVSVQSRDVCARVLGRIVRVATNPKDSSEPWRYRLAIVLEEPLPAELLACADDEPPQT